MASGKFRNIRHDRTLLDAGLHASFVNKGFLGHVSHFDGRGFHLSLPCGEIREFLFGDDLRSEKLSQWKHVLTRCFSSSLRLSGKLPEQS